MLALALSAQGLQYTAALNTTESFLYICALHVVHLRQPSRNGRGMPSSTCRSDGGHHSLHPHAQKRGLHPAQIRFSPRVVSPSPGRIWRSQ